MLELHCSFLNRNRIILNDQVDADRYLVDDYHIFPHAVLVTGRVEINLLSGVQSFFWCKVRKGAELLINPVFKYVNNELNPEIKVLSHGYADFKLRSSCEVL
jgi:hypothetical protein